MLPVTEIVLPQLASNVPAFLAKLWKMVDDPDTNYLISWGDNGNSFVIHNQVEFCHQLLPYYYKHSNMASFVRQLNMYGFHKVVGIESGGLKSEKDQEMEFAHTFFLRGQEILLCNIKRRVATNKAPTQTTFAPSIKTEKVTEVLNEVNQLKDKQEDMDSKLDTMKKENEALWREVITLRQKHTNQQKIVNKLIHFLMGYLQTRIHPPGNTAVKRRFQQPLAIESRGPKEPKVSFDTENETVDVESTDGPIIFDVTNTDLFGDSDLKIGTAPVVKQSPAESPKVEVPMSPLSQAMQAIDPTLVNPAISVNKASSSNPFTFNAGKPSSSNSLVSSTPTNRPKLQREISKEDFDVETMLMQKDLDNLKDLLSGQITLDSNLISNLFNPNEPLVIESPDTDNVGGGGQQLSLQLENPDSHKLISADDDEQPTLFELADIDDNDEALMPPPQIGQSSNYPSLDTPLLETPLLTDDTLDVNPLLAQITKRGKKGKNL